ncbi:protein of unknown function [Chryseobacterium soldanellicola]|uniref:DUF4822 domain-containing protein n=1 Tax=Chryseobacterium soldanellicola TaxID=311333 RepID=A0A1H0YBU5_9FLAO|nr:DUF4822 domain-containing protein [Chryseobacterium soldanellicola]SDQ12540.1 protein of unknown function [Chryseobacterium soldanellicola]
MRVLKIAILIVVILSGLSAVIVSCNAGDPIYGNEITPSQTLASTKWKAIIVKDAHGNDVTGQNKDFAGYTEYNLDGTFKTTNFDGALKSIGDWSITPDGKRRILVGKNLNGNGEIVSTGIVDIITLTPKFFVYSIVLNGQKMTVEHISL